MASLKPSDRILAPALRVQPDRRLVTLAREGSEPAVEEIVRRFRPELLRYAASIVPADRADDVVQDSLARALPGIGSGEGDLHLRPWLYTIVRNTAFNSLRDAGPPHEQLDESYDGVEQPPQAMERREQVRSLVAGLQALPEPQRDALVKREMEGRSHAEIGAELGVSTGAARQLIFRARNALRDGIGSLVPMPVLRQLLDGGGGTAVAGGGSAVAIKAAVTILATGAAVTAGLAVRNAAHHALPTPGIAAQPRASGGNDAPRAGGGRAIATTGTGAGGSHADRSSGGAGPHRHGASPVGPLPAGGGSSISAGGGPDTADGGHSGGSSGRSPGGSGDESPQAIGGGGPDSSGHDGTGGHDGSGLGGSQSEDGSPEPGDGSGGPSGQPASEDGESSGTSGGGGDSGASDSSGPSGTSDSAAPPPAIQGQD